MLVATACGPAETGPGASGSAATSEKAVAGGHLVEGQIGDPKTFQPVIASDSVSSNSWGQVYISLLRVNRDNGDLEPGLADKWDVSADGKIITFTLKDGLVWSDGQPFTGDDYKYTVEAIARSKKTVRKSTFQDVDGWADYVAGKTDTLAGLTVSNGGKTITVTFAKVSCGALRAIHSAQGGIIPKHSFLQYWDNKSTDATKNIDDNPLNMAPPASMGPWVFKSFTPGQTIEYVRNDKYYRGPPLVEQFTLKNYADANAVKAAFLVGEVSYIAPALGDVDELKKDQDAIMTRFPSVTAYNYIGWNAAAAKAPWLKNKQVRQALWYGINVQAIIDKIVFGYGKQVYTHIPAASWAYSDAGLNHYAYDPAKAKQLLESAGAKMGSDGVYRWTDGSPMKMRIETNQGNTARETILQFAQDQYKQIGIQIDPLLESFNALLDRTVPGTDYEGYILGWTGLAGDPDNASYSIFHSTQRGKDQFNNVDFVNAQVDKDLDQGRNGPDCSKETRAKLYQDFGKILNDEAPYTFLYSGDAIVFYSKKLQNIQAAPYSSGSAWNIEKWWIKP
jgi:peptide/nickel transport system substrate-binding protein